MLNAARPSRVDWCCLVITMLLSSAWCVTAGTKLGATFDEPTYVAAGLDRWRTGQIGGLMRMGAMPLAIDVMTLPLYVIERVRGVPFAITTDAKARPVDLTALPQVLRIARAGTLVFWWLLLYYGWRIAFDLAGPWGGRLALALLGSEPNLLAHASLATTDIAVTSCLLALTYRFRIGRNADLWPRVGVPTIWFALALLSKASVLLLGPLCLLAVAVQAVADEGSGHDSPAGGTTWHRWRTALEPAWRDGGLIVAGGIGLAFLYCGSDWRREESFVAWTATLPDGPLRATLAYVADHLAIFSNAGEGMVQKIKHNIRGQDTYLLGRSYNRAIWYYFPVILSMKLTTPALGAVPLLGLIRPRALRNYALLLAAILTLCSVSFRPNLGIRVVLPIVAVLLIGLSAATVDAIRTLQVGTRVRASIATAIVTLGIVVTTVDAWPRALTFINALWGGTGNGYLLVSDSNYDWGQGVPELREWQRTNHLSNLAVWYWGTDPGIRQGPWQPMELHRLQIQSGSDVIELLRGKHLAASTTLVYGSVLADTRDAPPEIERMKRATREVRTLLKARTPIARTSTFLIYDFTAGLPLEQR